MSARNFRTISSQVPWAFLVLLEKLHAALDGIADLVDEFFFGLGGRGLRRRRLRDHYEHAEHRGQTGENQKTGHGGTPLQHEDANYLP